MTAAERQTKHRQGKTAFTVLLTHQTAEALRNYLSERKLPQNETIEKLIISQLLRKR
jgi:hypothetical protein